MLGRERRATSIGVAWQGMDLGSQAADSVVANEDMKQVIADAKATYTPPEEVSYCTEIYSRESGDRSPR